MEQGEEFDLNFAIIRRILNMTNDGLIIKIPPERLDFIARKIVEEILLLIVGKNNG